jgi:hypothetical protein
MSKKFLPNARGNKIVTYLSDAKLKLDVEFAKLSTEFDLLSNYPPAPPHQTLVTWAADLKNAADELIWRANGLVTDVLAEQKKEPAAGGNMTELSVHIESNYPPGVPR